MTTYKDLVIDAYAEQYSRNWFKMDEGSGNILNDSKGVAVGTVSGATWLSDSGLSFDGNDFVSFNTSLFDTLNRFCLMFEVKTTQSTTGYIFSSGGGTPVTGIDIAVYLGSLNINFWYNGQLNQLKVENFSDGAFKKVVLYYDGSKITLLINDNLIKEVVYTLPKSSAKTFTYIGRNRDINSDFFVGEIKNVVIFNENVYDFKLKKTLILSNGEYKKWDVTNGWTTVSSTLPNSTQFLSDGMDSLTPLLDRVNGVSPLDSLSGNLEVLTWTDETDSTRVSELNVSQHPQLVYPTGDISLAGVDAIDKFTLIANGSAKVAISFDSRATWKAYKNGAWVTVANAHDGMTANEINTLTREQIAEARGDSQFIQFSYSLSDDAEVDNISMQVSMQGNEKIADSSDYDLSYDSVNKTIVYNIKKSGTYSVNYVT